MPLELAQVASQIENLVARLRAEGEEREQRLQQAVDLLCARAEEYGALNRKIAASKTTWLIAGLTESPHRVYPAPPCPEEFSVLAVDGSHIDVDRHSPLSCYLINIGSALLRYGKASDAWLSSTPVLYSGEELVIADPGGGNREEPVERALLGVKRSVEECRGLVRLARELSERIPALALLDGSLILWGLAAQAFPEFVKQALLERGFLAALDELRELSRERNLALASYISYPRSTEVLNALRLLLCPYQPADCDRYCPGKRPLKKRECDSLTGLQDRELFRRLLAPGERSALFLSRSSIVHTCYREHQIYFYYVRTEAEVARVELPQWVAEDRGLLELSHAILLEQCQRGQGYPVSLSEAHEKAVITAADREQFWHLVETALARSSLPAQGSAKSRSKRMRWV
jgi:hypothetical protein